MWTHETNKLYIYIYIRYVKEHNKPQQEDVIKNPGYIVKLLGFLVLIKIFWNSALLRFNVHNQLGAPLRSSSKNFFVLRLNIMCFEVSKANIFIICTNILNIF